MNQIELNGIRKQFEYYKVLGDDTFNQLNDDQLSITMNENSNSIAMIVKHLHGNLLSRWTDFLFSDGEKEWRNRDEEFENDLNARELLLSKWEEGWNCLFNAIDSLKVSDLDKTVFIRNQGHSVFEAFLRSLNHIAYHVGQIVFIGKILQNDNWKTLSIPKGKSKEYNQTKFHQPKHFEHFSDESILKSKKSQKDN